MNVDHDTVKQAKQRIVNIHKIILKRQFAISLSLTQ